MWADIDLSDKTICFDANESVRFVTNAGVSVYDTNQYYKLLW